MYCLVTVCHCDNDNDNANDNDNDDSFENGLICISNFLHQLIFTKLYK